MKNFILMLTALVATTAVANASGQQAKNNQSIVTCWITVENLHAPPEYRCRRFDGTSPETEKP